MKLPFALPTLDKKPKKEYYLALLLRDEKATAVVIEESSGHMRIVGKHEEEFAESLDVTTQDTLLEVLDKTISRAEETLPADVETHKTIFGVKESWIDEKRIKKEHLQILKRTCDELDLTPIGFLMISEAIIHLIQNEEGSPVTAILADIGKKTITLSLFRAGKHIETHTTARTESVVHSVDTLLKEFTSVEVLPTRIIIFSESNADEQVAQQFISHQWSKSLPFLHVPQIAVVPTEFDIKSVVFGAATQLGFTVIGTHLQANASDIHTIDQSAAITDMTPETDMTTEDLDTSGSQESTQPVKPQAASASLGFVLNQDVALTKPIQKEKNEEESLLETKESRDMQHAMEHGGVEGTRRHKPFEDNATPHNNYTTAKRGFVLPAFIGPLKQRITTFTSNRALPFSLPQFKTESKLIFIPPVILVFLIMLGLLYVFQLKATILLDIKQKNIEEEQAVTFAIDESSDFTADIIGVTKTSVTIPGSLTVDTTGKKEIGDKAKGTITLYNSNDSRKQIAQGTEITSNNKLVFIVDKDVSVASASGDIFSGTKPGTASVTVTAKVLGTEYNLPSNTTFTVSGGSGIAGKNDSAFSGGTKKEVQVVAKADIDNARKDLPESLITKAQEEMNKKLGDGNAMLPTFTETSLAKESISKKVGEEAKNIQIKADVVFTAIIYEKNDLTSYAKSLLQESSVDNLTISDKSIEPVLSDIKQDDETLTAKITVKGGLLPKIDQATLAKDVTGKSFDEATDTLRKLPQVDTVKITLSPNIPFLPKILPRQSKNITFTINTNE